MQPADPDAKPKRKRKAKNKPKWKKAKMNTFVYVDGFPPDVTEEEVFSPLKF